MGLSVRVAVLMGLAPLATQAQEFVFELPSGNIACAMTPHATRCDIREADQSYTTPPADCDGDYGFAFSVAPEGEGAVACVTDAIGGAEAAPVLPYGAQIAFGGVTCASATTGVTCMNREGGGFSLRRARQQVF